MTPPLDLSHSPPCTHLLDLGLALARRCLSHVPTLVLPRASEGGRSAIPCDRAIRTSVSVRRRSSFPGSSPMAVFVRCLRRDCGASLPTHSPSRCTSHFSRISRLYSALSCSRSLTRATTPRTTLHVSGPRPPPRRVRRPRPPPLPRRRVLPPLRMIGVRREKTSYIVCPHERTQRWAIGVAASGTRPPGTRPPGTRPPGTRPSSASPPYSSSYSAA